LERIFLQKTQILLAIASFNKVLLKRRSIFSSEKSHSLFSDFPTQEAVDQAKSSKKAF
jgi:hypothetical protein